MGSVAQAPGLTLAYTRVSSMAQKPDLANQTHALEDYCSRQRIEVNEWLEDIGSGLNYKRRQFIRLFEMVETGHVSRIIIAHRDRLVRFGFEWFEAFCHRHGTQIVVMSGEALSPEKEMVEDLLAVVTVFSARFHGLRSYKRSREKAVEHADQQKDQD